MENLLKAKRTNSRFLADLCMAEAAIRPFINDWTHLEPDEVHTFQRCARLIVELQQEARDYENYLREQILNPDAVR